MPIPAIMLPARKKSSPYTKKENPIIVSNMEPKNKTI
jgi:hypothetical protein